VRRKQSLGVINGTQRGRNKRTMEEGKGGKPTRRLEETRKTKEVAGESTLSRNFNFGMKVERNSRHTGHKQTLGQSHNGSAPPHKKKMG